jgi:F-type H+-transporting ATPase subunit delta
MADITTGHETVLGAGERESRLARVYAEALLATVLKQTGGADGHAEAAGAELIAFVRALAAHPDAEEFLTSPVVSRKVKAAALARALAGNAPDLLRRFLGVLQQNNRLHLLRAVAAAYQRLLDTRAGRVRVKVAAAVPLSDEQRAALTANLKVLLGNQEPVLEVRVDPDLLGGLVVQVGDSVVDTSVRTRLQSLRSLLLAR